MLLFSILRLAYVHEGLDLHSGLGMAKGLWRAWPVTRWHWNPHEEASAACCNTSVGPNKRI